MAQLQFANQRLGYCGTLVETVPGTFQTGSDFDQLPGMTISLDPQSETVILADAGAASPEAARVVSDHVTGSVTYALRFADLDAQIARGFREVGMPTEVSASVTATLTASGASHLDGTTGAQIRVVGSNDALDALVAASSNADLEGVALRIIGSAADDWDEKGYVVAKPGSPRNDGADTVVDLEQRYQLAASGLFSPWAGETGVAITIDAGALVRNKVTTAGGEPSYSLLFYLPDVSLWYSVAGVRFGPPSFSFGQGRGGVMVTQSFIGGTYAPLTDTSPISPNLISAANLGWSPHIIGGVDVKSIYIGGATIGIHLAGCFVTSLELANAGDWSPVVGTLGGSGLCGTLGARMDPTATLNYNVYQGADPTNVSRALQVLSNPATREECYLDVFLQDTDGNQLRLALFGTPPLSVVSSIGGDGDAVASGTFSLTGKQRTKTGGGAVFQRWALGASEV